MITIPALTAPGQVVQHLVPPSVYLDHWAFNAVARDDELAARFTEALARCGGTLAFSWANVAEFSKVLDQDQARQAEHLINAQVMQVFCIDVDPFRVMAREEHGDGSAAASDDLVLRGLARLRAQPPRLVTADGLLTVVRGRLDEVGERLAAIFLGRYEALTTAYADDHEFRRLVKNAPKSAATLSVMREILATFLVDTTWKADDHDVLDFYHAVVPSVYCDYVVLDKDWAVHVSRAEQALRRAGAERRMATVLSKRVGIDELITRLEAA